MQSSAQIKQQYDELLALYSKKRSENDAGEKSLKEINQAIANLQLELENLSTLPAKQIFKPSVQQERQLQQLTLKIKDLTQQLKSAEEQNQNIFHSQNDQELTTLNEMNSKLKIQLQSLHSLSINTNLQYDNVTKTFTDIQNKSKETEKKAQQIGEVIQREEREITELQNQLLRLQGQKKSELQNLSAASDINQFKGLQDQLALLQQDEKQLLISIEKQIQVSLQLQQIAQATKQKQSKELNELKNTNAQLLKEKVRAENQINSFSTQDNRTVILQQNIQTISQKNKEMIKDIENLQKSVKEKKIELQKKREEENLLKKTKQKPRNFKQEINQAQKQQQILIKELERESIKLADTTKIRKSYVSSENLHILQKELERHHSNNKPSLMAEQTKKDKLLKENQVLKSRIEFLKKSSQQLQEESQNRLKEVKAKGEQLVNQKLVHEKYLNQVTGKLNDYMKEFPDHQKNKEDKKNEERRLKQELKEKQRERIKLQKEKARIEKQNYITSQGNSRQKQEDSNQTAWQRWDKWQKQGKLGTRDETSIFNNRQFQLVAGIVALVAILVLIFGV